MEEVKENTGKFFIFPVTLALADPERRGISFLSPISVRDYAGQLRRNTQLRRTYCISITISIHSSFIFMSLIRGDGVIRIIFEKEYYFFEI